MAKEEKKYHPNFITYMKTMANDPNYYGLPIEKRSDDSYKWVATAKSKIGMERIAWCKAKAHEMNIPEGPGMYAEVMLKVHPTKLKPCQICGKEMSLYYHYPNANFLKSLNREFHSNFTTCDHISDIWDCLIAKGVSSNKIASFLIQECDLKLNTIETKERVIDSLEYACRKNGKKCLGPGAMSNFPDRFDGFHSYNRCCRSTQDKGRSKANLKSYTKDRRAYEYWSDGNIHAANKFMGSDFFEGVSADHIGPISLGFVHDSVYLQPMKTNDNSIKRDRLSIKTIEGIIKKEEETGIYPMSWQSRLIWDYIKLNYKNNPRKVSTSYRDALIQNRTNYFFILWTILDKCGQKGEDFLISAILSQHYHDFDYSYSFNKEGRILRKVPRHNTDRNANELTRYNRIAIDSVREYHNKENRWSDPYLTPDEHEKLELICRNILQDIVSDVKIKLVELMEHIEIRLISKL